MAKNLVNVVAAEPVKRFQPILTQTFLIMRSQAFDVLKIMGSEVKVIEDIY